MKKSPDLYRIKSTLQSMEAKRISLVRNMEDLMAYYKNKPGELETISKDLEHSFSKLTAIRDSIDFIDELKEIEDGI
jgi:hypothetical protein